MKASITRTILVELTEREAEILVALVGGISWNGSEASIVVSDFHQKVDPLVPMRTESFQDFFEVDHFGDLVAR